MSDPVILRPHFRTYWQWVKWSLIGIVAIVVIYGGIGLASAHGHLVGLAWVILFLVGCIVALGVVAVWILTSSITLEPNEIVWRRWLWRVTRMPTGIGTTGLMGLWTGSVANPARWSRIRGQSVVKLRMRNGRKWIALNAGIWEIGDLKRIAEYAGPGVISDADVHGVQAWEKRVPGTTTWSERHGVLLGLIIGFGIVIVVVAAVIVPPVVRHAPPFDPTPRRAVPAAIADAQDAVLTQVLDVVHGEHKAPETFLEECKDSDQYKGWQRSVMVDVTLPGTTKLSKQQLDSLVSIGDAAHYTNAYESPEGDSFDLYAKKSDRDVSIDVTDGVASINSTTDCETPAH